MGGWGGGGRAKPQPEKKLEKRQQKEMRGRKESKGYIHYIPRTCPLPKETTWKQSVTQEPPPPSVEQGLSAFALSMLSVMGWPNTSSQSLLLPVPLACRALAMSQEGAVWKLSPGASSALR